LRPSLSTGVGLSRSTPFFVWAGWTTILTDHEEGPMALFDDIPLFGDLSLSGNWVTGLAIGVGAVVILPLAAPVLRPLAKTAIKGGISPTRARLGCSRARHPKSIQKARITFCYLDPPLLPLAVALPRMLEEKRRALGSWADYLKGLVQLRA
jgi:hypothetical protein